MIPPRLNAARGTLGARRSGAAGATVPGGRAAFEAHIRALRRDLGEEFVLPSAFRGKSGESASLYPKALQGRPLLLAGLGPAETLSTEGLRRAAASLARQAVALGHHALALLAPSGKLLGKLLPHSDEPAMVRAAGAIAEGAALAAYAYDRYRTTAPFAGLSSITLLGRTEAETSELGRALGVSRPVVEGTWLARDLSNAPGNELYPGSLALAAQRSGRRYGFSVKVFGRRRLRSLGMGGLLGVAQGSARPPRFIILEYGRTRATTVVLVGKGITFDSGGISIKPSANMAEMRMDMAGAAAVLATVQTAARLKLHLHLVGLIPSAENLPGGRALKPGDILRHYNGKTSEVDNTDAEGRLVLADALGYAGRFKPDAVIDLATLTGAVVVALGHHATGMLGNDPALMRRLQEAGERTYERVWELPMFEEYGKLIKSEIADVKNTGGRWAGAITGAMFLKHFVGEYPWVHLDIAGTAIMEEQLDYIPKGASGVGVRLLIDLLRRWAPAGPASPPGR